jgi:septum formation protein
MIKTSLPFYLASKSPRRRKLLKQLGIDFSSFSVELDEDFFDGEHPVECVTRLAREKMAKAKLEVNDGIIITADTIVVLGKEVIGKPSDENEAEKYLKMLSGKTHIVYTGFSVFNSITQKEITDYEKTEVEFRILDDLEIKSYVKGGSPMDKAGAYGIQDDFGAVFVNKINGCYYNVVGLPLTKLYQVLRSLI